jgi:hypothetical protein
MVWVRERTIPTERPPSDIVDIIYIGSPVFGYSITTQLLQLLLWTNPSPLIPMSYSCCGVRGNTRIGQGMCLLQSGRDVVPFISRNRMLPLCCQLDTCQGTSIVWCWRVPSRYESYRSLSGGKSNWNLRMQSCHHITGLTDVSPSKQMCQEDYQNLYSLFPTVAYLFTEAVKAY